MNDSAPKTITRMAYTEWKGDLRAEIRAPNCAPFYSDEPKGRGGLFEHPTPTGYTIGALTGCSAAHVEKFAPQSGRPTSNTCTGLTLALFMAGSTELTPRLRSHGL